VIGTCDVVVLGCGIVGSACALECARAGMSVVVIEQDTPGSGATAAGMGHIVVMDDSPAQFALTSYSQSLWNLMAPELPTSVEYHTCGTIWVAADDEEMAEAHRKLEYYTSNGLPAEMLDSTTLREAEPNLRPSLAGGLRVLSDGVLYPPSAAGYLMEQVLLEDGTELHAGIIVNATGAISPELTPGIQVKKRKGHLIVTDRYPGFLTHQLVELGYLKSAHSSDSDSVAFNVQPRKTGQVLIGSSRQYNAEDSAVDHAIVAAMIERAALYMPGLSSLSALRIWSGFRAATPDKLPLIGPTEDPTLFLATGHEGLGITTSLATARLLLDHLLKRPSAISLAPYLPSRMAVEGAHA
jgi:glycine/D-amino acid oxidase-like deaminating enzyme